MINKIISQSQTRKKHMVFHFKRLTIAKEHATGKKNIYVQNSYLALKIQTDLSEDKAKRHPEDIKLKTPL